MKPTQLRVLVTLFVAYASLYLCRSNLEAAGPLLALEGYDKTRFGALLSVATFAYAMGKFAMGAAGDVLGGRRLILAAVGGSVACTLAFSASSTFAALLVFAAANRFFLAGGWSGLVHVVSRWFEPRRHGLVMGVLSASFGMGDALVRPFCGYVARWGWRALFVVNPILMVVIAGGLAISLPKAPPSTSASALTPMEESEQMGAVLSRLARNGGFWATTALSALLTFVRMAFLAWTPTYLFEVSRAAGHVEVSGAIVKSAIFPAAGVVASVAIGWASDWFGPGRRAPLMAASLVVVAALVLALAHAGVRDPLSAALLIGTIGFFLLGPYSLLAGAFALDVAGRRGTATATGIIDGAGYLAATASGYVLGTIADRVGWSAVFDVVAAATLAAAAISGAWSVAPSLRQARRHSAHR